MAFVQGYVDDKIQTFLLFPVLGELNCKPIMGLKKEDMSVNSCLVSLTTNDRSPVLYPLSFILYPLVLYPYPFPGLPCPLLRGQNHLYLQLVADGQHINQILDSK